jgi:uncharacterized protein (DUF1499 family)
VDEGHRIETLPWKGDAAATGAALRAALGALPRTRIVQDDGAYLYAECTSAMLGFVDDIEFLIDSTQRVVHVRSASRLGRSDLGVNRRRVEAIRAFMKTAR